MIRRPTRSTQSRSSAASDVYKRQVSGHREASRNPDRRASIADRLPNQPPSWASLPEVCGCRTDMGKEDRAAEIICPKQSGASLPLCQSTVWLQENRLSRHKEESEPLTCSV